MLCVLFFFYFLVSRCTEEIGQSQLTEDSSHHDESFVPKSLVDCLRRYKMFNFLFTINFVVDIPNVYIELLQKQFLALVSNLFFKKKIS